MHEGDGGRIVVAGPGLDRTVRDHPADDLAPEVSANDRELPVVGAVPPVMWNRKVGKVGKPFLFNIGLLCSKTFDDAIFEELFEAKYGLAKAGHGEDEHQGRVPDLDERRRYHEIHLKECHAWTREGCKHCPDFAAEHADISTGGIGKYNDWTLTIVRTDLGREIISRMIADGVDRGPARRRRPRRHRADAQAVGEEPRALAGDGDRLPQEPSQASAGGLTHI